MDKVLYKNPNYRLSFCEFTNVFAFFFPMLSCVFFSAQICADNLVIDEVIVTAQKRAESLNEIGIAAAALNGDDMAYKNLFLISDLNGQTPNLNIRENGAGITTNVTIRGVGLQDFSINNTPTVGMYVDDVFLASTAQLNGRMFDLERLEVLKGPQGTLYGRNTTGGLLNFISAKPSQEKEALFTLKLGNYRTIDTRAVLNGGITDTLSARLAVESHRRNEGFYTNRFYGNESHGEEDVLSGRLQFAWAPSDTLNINLKLESSETDNEINPFVQFGMLSPTGGVCQSILNGRVDFSSACVGPDGYFDDDGDPFTGDWNGWRKNLDMRQQGATITVNWEVGEGTVTSITGYQYLERHYSSDIDGGPTTLIEADPNDQIEQMSQELRYASGYENVVDWIVGAFYSYDDVGANSKVDVSDLFGFRARGLVDQETTSKALYIHTDWYLNEKITLIVGGRHTSEKKEFKAGTGMLGEDEVTVIAQFSQFQDTLKDDRFSWKLGLEYEPNESLLLYSSISEGFKSGGFFGGTFVTRVQQFEPFKPEIITAYEAGFKVDLAEGAMHINGAAFYYDYSDIQIFTQEDLGGVIFSKLNNVSEAEVTGVEFDIEWLPVAGLNVKGGLGWLDSELGEFFVNSNGTRVLNPKGNSLASAPRLTFNAQVRYEFLLVDGISLTSLIEANYTDKTYKEPTNQEYLSDGDFTLYNARVGLRSDSSGWEVSLWGDNLTDEEYRNHVFELGFGSGGITYGQPRTYGVTFSYRLD
jgi:iron complex outermembrane recepter protein